MSKIKFHLSNFIDGNRYSGNYSLGNQRIYFKSKDYDKINSNEKTKFRGWLEFIYDVNNNLIYSLKWNFEKLTIDQMTTEAWFAKKTSNFRNREVYFEKLGINQIKRLARDKRTLYALDEDEIKIFNDFLNFEYTGSIKNIIGIIKGNNPSGAVSSPENEEMIRVNCKPQNSNFLLFLKSRKIQENLNEPQYKNSKKILFEIIRPADNYDYFENLKDDLKNMYISLNNYSNRTQEAKEEKKLKYKVYSRRIAKELENIFENDLHLFKNIEAKISKLRSEYQSNINKNFNFTFSGFRSRAKTQKAHIYQVKWIKEEIYNSWKKYKINNIEDEQYLKYFQMVSDPENYLSLEEEIHRMFDKNQITFDLKGKLIKVDTTNEGKEYLSEYFDDQENKKYFNIKKECLTKERVNYIKLKNKKIPNIGALCQYCIK